MTGVPPPPPPRGPTRHQPQQRRVSPFQRLARTHAAMAAGDAFMAVALADSLFLSISPAAARSRVLLFLLISFLPFAVVAPLIGPVIDRMRGGRRLVVVLDALLRALIAVLMIGRVDELVLFPLTFGALVLQKAYYVSKAALVPTVVRNQDEFVEANGKLGVLAGIVGAIAVVPAAIIQKTIGVNATLFVNAVVFVGATLLASRLPKAVVAAGPAEEIEEVELHSPPVQLGAFAMSALRAAVGFVFFLLAFWLRDQSLGTVWFAVAIGLAALATMAGNVIAPTVREHVREERMIAVMLLGVSATSILAAVLGGVPAGLLLAATVNGAAAVAKLAFDAIVQRDAPDANRGRAFARFELRFQLAWVLAGAVSVLLDLPGAVGFAVLAVGMSLATITYLRRAQLLRRGRGRAD